MSNEKLGTVIDGIGASEVIDSSGEVISIEGIDTSSLDVDGLINTEHESKTTTQLIGKVVSYHKIFKKEDCENDRQRYYWDKVEAPYLYIKAVMFDKFGHTGAKDAVAMMMFDKELNKENTRQVGGFSIEGSRLGKEGNRITKCIARKIAWSAYPCNKTCVAEILEEDKPIEITAKQLLAAFKKSEDMENDLKKADYLPIKAKPKQIKPFKPINAATGQHKEASPIEPKRTFESTKAPEKIKIGDQITYGPKKPKSGASIYKDPETWKSETNTIRQSIMKNMSKQKIQHRLMLSEEKDGMRKDILKKMADDAFEHFEKKEELIGFVTTQYPEMTEEEVLAFAKTFAYVQMKKSEMEMVKITDNIEGNDLQKARVDEGKSIEQKQSDRKARNSRVKFAAGSPKGSHEGKDVRPRKQGEGDKVFGKPKDSIKGVRSHSASHYNTKPSGKEHPANEAWRKEAGGKLSAINRKNLKQMPNPDLPKSEDMGKAEGEKGVHQRHPRVTFHDNKGKYLEGKTQGTSRAGHMNIEARRGERDPQDVLDAHSNKLKELKAMPKPNLPKSEDMGKAEHPHGYSEKNPKIDIHHKGKYHASTNWSKTLKQAKEKHLERNPEHKPEDVKAYYSNPKPKKK